MKLSAFDRWMTRGYDWQAEGPKQFLEEMRMCSCDEGGNRRCEIHKEEK